ncbi:MAG: alpha/beta fold hydrolase [Hyphomicrobiales bacterium]
MVIDISAIPGEAARQLALNMGATYLLAARRCRAHLALRRHGDEGRWSRGMTAHLDWARDGADRPNRAASRFVDAAGMAWHVQVMGEGPVILLLHGTGASTHSWRDVLPRLADRFTLVAPDLPGHEPTFTDPPPSAGQSLPGMASAVSDLLRKLRLSPFRGAGHSAGAAIVVRMAALGTITPDDIVSFNGASFPTTRARPDSFFTPLAKAAAATRFMPKLLPPVADERSVERLLKDTGSKIDARDLTSIAASSPIRVKWQAHRR